MERCRWFAITPIGKRAMRYHMSNYDAGTVHSRSRKVMRRANGPHILPLAPGRTTTQRTCLKTELRVALVAFAEGARGCARSFALTAGETAGFRRAGWRALGVMARSSRG